MGLECLEKFCSSSKQQEKKGLRMQACTRQGKAGTAWAGESGLMEPEEAAGRARSSWGVAVGVRGGSE
jgi:hypothetical protein